MSQILIFGPSTTYGAWDIEGGYAQRLRKFLDKKVIDSNYEEYFLVYNLGIDGDTAKGILERFESEAKPRMWPNEETIFIIAAGTNDSMVNNKTGEFNVPKEEYRECLNKIFSISKKYTEKVIFLGEHPIDESKTDPIPWLSEYSYKTKYIKEFDEISKKVCKKSKVRFIDIYSEIEKTNYKNNLVDGVHFNKQGHEKIFELIKNYLINNKII
jgi:lysophospholipase L1-like esterase